MKTGEFPIEISRMISSAMLIRQKSDYDDFYIASKDEAEKQLNNAKYVLGLIEKYVMDFEVKMKQ